MRDANSISRALAPFAAMLLLVVLNNQTSTAQSTIFNVPSTDVVAEKKVYLEFDFVSHLESHSNGGFQTYVPRVVVGVGKGVEVGVNVSATDAAAPDQPVYVSPNVKWQVYSSEEKGTAFSVGGLVYTPVAHRVGADTFGFVYFVASKKFKAANGPRVTGGAYALPGLRGDLGTKGGAIVAYEQPLFKRTSFAGDWFSGKNAFGYVTPGLSFAVSKQSLLNVGYSIGNHGRKNNALFVYYGITL
jgi:hypothetical protein